MKRYVKSSYDVYKVPASNKTLENAVYEEANELMKGGYSISDIEDELYRVFPIYIDNVLNKMQGSTEIKADTEYYADMTEAQRNKLNAMCGEENPGSEYQYQIQESFGSPQAGCSFFNFKEWYEVEEFLDEFPFIVDDIDGGYALIKELN